MPGVWIVLFQPLLLRLMLLNKQQALKSSMLYFRWR